MENTGVRSRRTEEERTRSEEAETPTVHVYTVFSNSTVFCDVCGEGDVKRMRRDWTWTWTCDLFDGRNRL